ncbi:MAG: hypothetical protein NT003_04210 [Candidatus Magasanikbacteria bacterium]|nr:hypothetical protein [Candidatus Magasanikbacteria bacterium]
MQPHESLGLLSGIIFGAAFVPYITSILRKERPAIPVRASWLIWSINGTIAFFAGTRDPSTACFWILLAGAAGPIITFLCSLKHTGPVSKVQITSLVIAAFSFGLYKMTQNATVMMLLVIVADGCGTWPTFLEVRKNPENEDKLAWASWSLGVTLNLAATILKPGETSWTDWIFAVWMFIGANAVTSQVAYGLIKMKKRT